MVYGTIRIKGEKKYFTCDIGGRKKKCFRIPYHTRIWPPELLELKMTVAKKEDLFWKTNDSCCKNLRVGHIHLCFFLEPLIKRDVNDDYMWAYKMCEKKEKKTKVNESPKGTNRWKSCEGFPWSCHRIFVMLRSIFDTQNGELMKLNSFQGCACLWVEKCKKKNISTAGVRTATVSGKWRANNEENHIFIFFFMEFQVYHEAASNIGITRFICLSVYTPVRDGPILTSPLSVFFWS